MGLRTGEKGGGGPSPRMLSFVSIGVLLAGSSVGARTVVAQTTYTWTGAASNVYGTAGNWSGGAGAPPDSTTERATLSTGAANRNISVAAPVTINRLTINGTSAYTLSGSAITLGGTSALISVSGSASHTIGNVLGGSASLSKSGTGSLMLNAANTFSGGTTLAGGKSTFAITARSAPGLSTSPAALRCNSPPPRQ